ncbi:hypothetical protein HK405_004657 [Cladochytrium tenue]|nr:hypothetical protein HK405_004657 [Cladochytrium tenue]
MVLQASTTALTAATVDVSAGFDSKIPTRSADPVVPASDSPLAHSAAIGNIKGRSAGPTSSDIITDGLNPQQKPVGPASRPSLASRIGTRSVPAPPASSAVLPRVNQPLPNSNPAAAATAAAASSASTVASAAKKTSILSRVGTLAATAPAAPPLQPTVSVRLSGSPAPPPPPGQPRPLADRIGFRTPPPSAVGTNPSAAGPAGLVGRAQLPSDSARPATSSRGLVVTEGQASSATVARIAPPPPAVPRGPDAAGGRSIFQRLAWVG